MTSRTLTGDEVAVLRARAQHLDRRAPREAIHEVVGRVVGIQAQHPPAAALSLRARVRGLRPEDVAEALEGSRSLVRTWVMRGTLHLVRKDDLPWMLGALDPSVLREVPRWLERRAGLDRRKAKAGARKVERALLRRGPLPRAEVAREIGLPPQAAHGLVRLGALEGRVCYGPQEARDGTFAATAEWLGEVIEPVPPPPGALATRFLEGYGPAYAEDLAAWWGTTTGAARKEWETLGPGTTSVDLGGREGRVLTRALRATGRRDEPVVRLLPDFDTYLLGHRNREAVLDPTRARDVNRGGGWIRPVILVDGRVAGTWRKRRRGRRLEIRAEPFARLPGEVRRGIEEEAQDVGRFLGLPVDVAVARVSRGRGR